MGTKRVRGTSDGGAELSALAVSRQIESLQSLYSAWAEVRQQRQAAAEARRAERDQLANRAKYLLNTVSAARAFAQTTPVPTANESKSPKRSKGKPRSSAKKEIAAQDPLVAFHAQAEAELAAATATLAAREAREEAEFGVQDDQLRVELGRRAAAHLQIHRPQLTLRAHPVGSEQVIVQAGSPSDEDAVLLLRVLFGRLPTRWGFFSDDGVEDSRLGAARLYPDEGVTEIFPTDPGQGDRALRSGHDFAPARLQIPIQIPQHPFPRFRFIHHGPVAEIESRREGKPYHQLMPRGDAELLTGYLLSLKLGGVIELVLEVG